jgi:translation initiation factor IF-3
LIEIASGVNPPVCKIIDYGKFRYEKEKKAKEAKKNQHQSKLKEIKFTPNISDHDYGYRCEQAKKFIKDGNRVKASVYFKGREMSYLDRGKVVLEKLKEDLNPTASIDKDFVLEGKTLSMTFTPASK